MRGCKIIVNADDFGRDEEATCAILECFQRGYINQTTLMVNMPYAEKAVVLAREAGFADKIGLHLNLTQGMPLTESIKRFSEMCDVDGNFRVNRVGCDGKVPPSLLEAIAKEVKAQAERYISFGLPLMHCDGHHHCHNRFGLYRLILPILKAVGFRSIRNQYTVFGPPWHGVRGRIGNYFFMREVRKLSLSTTEAFGGWNGESLERWTRFASVEIMVHPHYNADGMLINVTDSKCNTGLRMDQLLWKHGMREEVGSGK